MVSRALIVAVALAVGVTGVALAESYDGGWDVVGQAQSRNCPGYNMHLEVKGTRVSAKVGTALFTYVLNGTIAPDGSFDLKSPGGTAHATGKFSGTTATAEFNNDRCDAPRHGTGSKVN